MSSLFRYTVVNINTHSLVLYQKHEVGVWWGEGPCEMAPALVRKAPFRRHKKYVPEFIPEFVPEFGLNSVLYSGVNSGMNSGTNSGMYSFYVV